MEDLVKIIVCIVIFLVQGLAVKKKADRNRPNRQKRRSRPASSPQRQPVSTREQADDPSLSPERWLLEIRELEKSSHKQREAAPKSADISENQPVVPTLNTSPSAFAGQERTGHLREEQVRASELVVEKSIEAALPEVVKTAKIMAAPKMHPVRVSTRNLRQAVIMSEVLARPRAFDL